MVEVSSALATLTIGDGAPVVLVHGWSGYKESWGELPVALARSGHRAVAVDLPGTGDSSAPRGYRYRPVDHAAALVALLDEVGPAAIVAHSLGTQPAVMAAAQRPDLVRRLVAIAPKAVPPDRHPRRPRTAADLIALPVVGRRAAAAALRSVRRDAGRRTAAYRAAVAQPERISRDPRAQALLEDAADRLATADAYALMATLDHGLRLDLRDLAPLVPQPALVIVGERDPVLHPGQAISLVHALPHGRLRAIPDTGHLPHLERAGEVIDAIAAHLAAGEA